METTTSWRTRLPRMDDVTVLSALVAVAFAGGPSAGESALARRSDSEPIARVVVLGDSITYLSEAAIHAALDPAYTVEVNGIPGIEVAGQQSSALEYAQTQPDVVIVNLGTNDVGARRDPSDVISDLGAMASEFDPTSCVVLVTLTTRVPSDDFEQRAAAVNQWIRSQQHVADWDSALATTDPPTQLTTDTVHPSVEGQSVMAELIQQQVDACTA